MIRWVKLRTIREPDSDKNWLLYMWASSNKRSTFWTPTPTEIDAILSLTDIELDGPAVRVKFTVKVME